LLRVKRVDIQGFKSFCDRTEMRFHGSGIAAIVGPNGCGKSNLSDAISWVLGEQSARSLRGTRMEDVIFAGTRDRKPVGMASVTITLVDPNPSPKADGGGDGGQAPPEEITITRRLFRSGESEYLINGEVARLRDIQDIFMGTGLGPESYAIIEQGRIGQILSSKPQDRRAIIEEAAGVSKFKNKRRLAEAKLESAKQNLTRVFDILEEVSRQVNSLKRQAAKAKRYEELRAEMIAQLRRVLTGRFRALEREAAKAALDLSAAGQECQSLAAAVQERDQEYARAQERLFGLEMQLTEARRQLADLRLEQERTRGRLENQAQQIGNIDKRLAQGESETQELEDRLSRLAAALEVSAKRSGELELQTEEARAKLAAKSAERDKVVEDLRRREREIEQARQQVLRLMGEAASLRNNLAKMDEYLASMERDAARARAEEGSASADRERLAALKQSLQEKIAARQLHLESLVEKRRAVEEELAARRAEAVDARRRLEQGQEELSRLAARRDSVAGILAHRTYTTETVKLLFQDIEQGKAGELKPYGVLADFVEVDPAYERAAEEFLHDELEYVVVKNFQDAESGLEVIRANLDGRATFLVHPEPGAEIGIAHVRLPAIGPETGIVARLQDVLKLTNGLSQAPAELLPRLARCFLAADRASAQRLAMQYPDLYFLLPDGICYHGHAVSGGRKTGQGPLGLKRELREVSSLAAAKQRQVEQTSRELAALEEQIARLAAELEALRASQQSEEKEAVALEHEMRKLTEEWNRANQRLSVARLELQRIEKEKARVEGERGRTLAEAEQREAARLEEERALAAAREALGALQAEAAKLGEEHSVLRVELAEAEERRRSEKANCARLEAEITELKARRGNLFAELERLGVERARLLADNIELDGRAAALTEEIAAAETGANELAAGEAQHRERMAALDEDLRQLRAALQAKQEQRSQAEVELVRLQSDLRHLDETSRKELGLPCRELAESLAEELSEDALAEAEDRYGEIKDRIDALGAVNPQALEEYQEAQQRYDFLNAQRQDLIDSIRDTEKAIQEIDTESRKRFSEAFEAINAHFREMFTTLFGGGTGEMRLTDEANLSESGIDIVAQPPGKRLQNVLLLSGGEKALTAIALLMAVFRYQPSPFCILDEVDAPLDEPNIVRLTKLLQEMAQQTQFILITHAKRTMECAQALYGVTMQEPGVSKLVSVRFQPPPEETAAAPAAQATM
jgi:chromosome segregation protein